MSDFLTFIDRLTNHFPVHVDIHYSKITDWCISVKKVGCASDYPESDHIGNDAILCDVQDCDMELAFARAQVAVKDWLIHFNEGY